MNTIIEVPVTLNFKGHNYQTNVIARKDTPETQIFQKAWEQVAKQWTNY